MVDQERDRYGDKLKEAERGREEDYFTRRDRELIKKMRETNPDEHCPKCGATLQREGSGQSACPKCQP
jgi:tRNA(Ile2) C34 agmatinyltransferase TiaS